MGVKRVVDTCFWTDTDTIDVYSCEDKYFFLYLLTNPHTKQCGIYSLPKKFISFETGYSKECVDALLERFQNRYRKILYNNETQEIAVLNSLKYSVVKGGKPVEDCIKKELSEIKYRSLIAKTYNHMLVFWDGSDRPFDQNIKAIFKEALEKESIKEKDLKDKNKENDNDNDNEESYHDSYHDSSTSSNEAFSESYPQVIHSVIMTPKCPQKNHVEPPKESVIKFAENVKMTQKEYDSLVKRLGSEKATQRCIEILDDYKGAHGKKYKSDFRAIHSWVIERYEEELERKSVKRGGHSIAEKIEQAKKMDEEMGLGNLWGTGQML